MEIWDVLDEERQKTDKTVIRGSDEAKTILHNVVHAAVINSNNELLIQHRQPFKESWSDLWDITMGGSSIKGETSKEACKRELKEEIGLDVDLSNNRAKFTINFDQGFDDYYVIKQDVDLSKLVLQYEEVKEVKWASIEEIKQMIKDGTFCPYHECVIDMLFAMKDSYGSGIEKGK